MIHQPLGGAQGQATEIQIAAEHILKTKKKLNQILADNAGKPVEEVEKTLTEITGYQQMKQRNMD